MSKNYKLIKTRTCIECNQIKEFEEFNFSKTGKSIKRTCKKCEPLIIRKIKPYSCNICGSTDPKDFKYKHKSICYGCYNKVHHLKEMEKIDSLVEEDKINKILKTRIANTRLRAIKKGWEFDLTLEGLKEIYEQQNRCCVYTKIPFDNSREKYVLSIDRIDSKGGYTLDNVQFILHIINTMKLDSTEEEFINFCKLTYLNSIS